MSYIKNRVLKRRINKATIGSIAVVFLLTTFVINFIHGALASQNIFGYSSDTLTVSSSSQTARVSIKALTDVTFYSFEGNYFANEDYDGDTAYFTLDYMAYSNRFRSADVLENTVNEKGGIFYWKNTTDGVFFSAGETIWTGTYTVAANTPAGTYSLPIALDAVSFGPNSYLEEETINAVVEIEGEHFTGTFSIDNNLTVYACSVQYDAFGNCNGASYTINDGDTLGIRNASGIYDISGQGQLNLRIIPDSGYVVDTVDATEGTFNAVKGPADIDVPNGYRITKITDDTSITITSSYGTGYSARLVYGEGISTVRVCSVQYNASGFCNGEEQNLSSGSSIYAKASNGSILANGSDQLNFIVVTQDGYKLDIVDLEDLSNIISINSGGVYNNIKTISSDINSFRITQIASNINVTITATAQTVISPAVSAIPNQTYSGSAITPEIEVTANIGGSDEILKNEADYTYTISNNINAGAATINIYPVATSDYYFSAFSSSFTIDPYQLTTSNINVPAYILEGNSLSANDISVTANSTTLTACSSASDTECDYLLTIEKASGSANENANGYITGKNGNYTGTALFTVPIQAKPNQSLQFDRSSVTVEWGDVVVNKLRQLSGDGQISYWTSDTTIATVSGNGTIILNGIGDTTVYAQAAETENYAETTVSYTLSVEKKSLTITNVSVSNKVYDKTNFASISSISLNDSSLVYGTDYTADAVFANTNVGTNIAVTVTVTITDTTHYELSQDSYLTSAAITALTLTNSNTSAALNTTEYTYSGSSNQPNANVIVTINNNDYTLAKNTDYTITYSDDTVNSGTKYAVITGIGNYSGSLQQMAYNVLPATIYDLAATIPSQSYVGEVLTPNVTVTASFLDGAIGLIEGTDYSLDYNNSIINAGDYPVTIRPVNGSNFTFDTISETFTINPHALKNSDVSLEYLVIHYTGSPLEPTVTVTINNNEISPDYYTVSYPDNTTDINDNLEVTISGTTNPANLTGSIVKTYSIVDKDVLTISGVPDNQSVTYTGSPVELQQSLNISGTNSITGQPYSISENDLTITWYAADGTTVISQPTDAGSYMVTYSYSDENCVGQLSVNFTIEKATSPKPAEMTANLSAESGQTLADISGTRTLGFTWNDDNTVILAGTNDYPATYTFNNDSRNYTTLNLQVPVYGLKRVSANVSINGSGDYSTSDDLTNILEGDTITLTFSPAIGYKLASVIVNGEDMIDSVKDNTLSIVASDSDIDVSVKYAIEEYTITMTDEGTFSINADYSLFENGGKVYIDKKIIKPTNYTSWSGSIYIKLTEQFMDSLTVGEHTISVMLNHGGVVETTFEHSAILIPDTGFFSREKLTTGTLILLPTAIIVITGIAIKLYEKFKKPKISFKKY